MLVDPHFEFVELYDFLFISITFFVRDTSAEVKKYSQNANDAAQDVLNSNQAEILDEMD